MLAGVNFAHLQCAVYEDKYFKGNDGTIVETSCCGLTDQVNIKELRAALLLQGLLMQSRA